MVDAWWAHAGAGLRGFEIPAREPLFLLGTQGRPEEETGSLGRGRGRGGTPADPVCPPTHLPLLCSFPLARGDHRMLLGLCPVPPAPSPHHGAPTGMSRAPALPRSRMDDLGAG